MLAEFRERTPLRRTGVVGDVVPVAERFPAVTPPERPIVDAVQQLIRDELTMRHNHVANFLAFQRHATQTRTLKLAVRRDGNPSQRLPVTFKDVGFLTMPDQPMDV